MEPGGGTNAKQALCKSWKPWMAGDVPERATILFLPTHYAEPVESARNERRNWGTFKERLKLSGVCVYCVYAEERLNEVEGTVQSEQQRERVAIAVPSTGVPVPN